jgi:hypothetical protein
MMPFPRTPAAAALLLVVCAAPAADPTPEQAEFFERKVRPVLVEHCYKCHSAQSAKGPKGGLRLDGRTLLLKGGDSGPTIVPGDPGKSKLIEAVRYANPDLQMPPKGKLPAAAIADLEKWVKDGAYWPGGTATTGAGKSGFDLAKRKAEHWAWRPVRPQTPPEVKDANWPADPVDRFILAKLEAKGLRPAPPAGKLVWLRRVTFALTGLPPTPEEVAAFQRDDSPAAFARVVDRLLASSAYGERWGRYWLDLVRYAESRGHEMDPDIPNAHQYRDYVVRALNADVPYNRLVLEHLAGDVLPDPRLDPKTGANESVIGTGFWHLGEEVHSPVDIRQDQADRLDNRIDVLGKAFLGLTVACARCHDHKFDAISTKDYYALYGLLEGSGYRQVRFDGWEQNRRVAEKLAKLRCCTTFDASGPPEPPTAYRAWLAKAKVVVDYADLKPGEWLPDDVTFGPGPRPAGAVVVRRADGKPTLHVEERTAAVFDHFWAGLRTAPGTGTDSGVLGKLPRAGFTIRTPNFVLERTNLYYLVRGGGMAYAAVCGHTVIQGPLHGGLVLPIPDAGDYRWVAHKLDGYRGQPLHAELTADPKTEFAVALVVQADEPPPGVPPAPARPGQARPLAGDVEKWIDEEEKLAAKVVWESRLAPALLDGTGVDEHVFVRGNPRTPGEVVPRRLLEALAGPVPLPPGRGSGRLEFAAQLTDPARNPFVSRVAVNRVWHHLFGRGIVATTDNFGVLGEPPTHPELLDYLATEFVRDGWSLKRLIRRLVLSSTYRMSSEPVPDADRADPANLLLHRFRLRRLEGEAIRDAILAVSGRLDRTIGGLPVPIHLTPFLDGRGRPKESGPLDGDGRRSLYLAVRRNFLSPMLLAFDTPIPFSCVGRRQVSNVPAQALILLNDPFVHQQAAVWAKKVLAAPGTADERVRGMYLAAFARPPTDEELAACRGFVAGKEADAAAWADLAHALFNVKEFIFVQ